MDEATVTYDPVDIRKMGRKVDLGRQDIYQAVVCLDAERTQYALQSKAPSKDLANLQTIEMQAGTYPEAGPNGTTLEALLSVVIDRLEGFQAGGFSCHENDRALSAIRDARAWLDQRTQRRVDEAIMVESEGA